MATTFPTTIDSLTNPQPTDPLNLPSHSAQHQNANDAIKAIETKLGVDNSIDTTSIDYKLKSTSSTNPGHKHTLADGATDITASAAELNLLDGVTATTTELNYVDTTAGTASANKALILGATKNTDILLVDKAIKFNAPDGFLVNGQISRSVASNNLTVALKTTAGNDPSASDPVYVTIAGTTYAITSALSVTTNAGTNWFGAGNATTATYELDYFTYLGVNSGSVFIGFSLVGFGTLVSEMSTTSTEYNYLAASVTPSSSDPIRVIGRFNAILSGSSSYNWSLPATAVIVNKPINESRVLEVTAQATGYSSKTADQCVFKVVGDSVNISYRIVGTSNGTGLTVQLPAGFINRLLTVEFFGVPRDNGNDTFGMMEFSINGTTGIVYRWLTGASSGANLTRSATFTGSGDKRFIGQDRISI